MGVMTASERMLTCILEWKHDGTASRELEFEAGHPGGTGSVETLWPMHTTALNQKSVRNGTGAGRSVGAVWLLHLCNQILTQDVIYNTFLGRGAIVHRSV